VEYKNPVLTSQETYYVSATDPAGYFYVRFDVFTAVSMMYAVFWDVKAHFVPHRKHATSPYIAQPVNAIKDLTFSRRCL
jgi:hypothetical protein